MIEAHDDLVYLAEGTRGELEPLVRALALSGVRGFIRPNTDCPPTA